MFTSENLASALRTVASALQVPVLLFLLILLILTVFMFGTLIAEYFTERIRFKIKIPKLLDKIRDGTKALPETIAESGLLKRQRKKLTELCAHKDLDQDMREALARRLLYEEQARNGKIVRITDLIARLGPMIGLLGTLIPLGPGLIALGQGDTFTLSKSLLIAFDTTVAGLGSAAVAFIVSGIRKVWYEDYLAVLETVMECVLEREAENG